MEFFWSLFSRILTEYGEILRIFPYSVQMRENTNQKNSKYGQFLCSVEQMFRKLLSEQRDNSYRNISAQDIPKIFSFQFLKRTKKLLKQQKNLKVFCKHDVDVYINIVPNVRFKGAVTIIDLMTQYLNSWIKYLKEFSSNSVKAVYFLYTLFIKHYALFTLCILYSFIFQLRVSNSKIKNKSLIFGLVTQSETFYFQLRGSNSMFNLIFLKPSQ